MVEGPNDPQPLRFSNEAKLRKQMRKRKWTDAMIRQALAQPGVPAMGKLGPATRYLHPTTGGSVLVDNQTGEIFHVGERDYGYHTP